MAIEVEGLDQLINKFGRAIKPTLQKAAMAVAKAIEAELAPYAEAGPWNYQGGPGSHWYKRGEGSRYMTVAGEIRKYGGSQNLGKKWVVAREGEIGASLKNSVTYSGLVHSAQDQVQCHRDHGWVTDEQAIKRVVDSGTIKDIYFDALAHDMGIRWG